MIRRLSLIVAAVIFALAAQAQAQTTGLEMQMGASPDRNGPPVEMNMAWAKEKKIVLPPGKALRVFVLWGDFGRQGQWLSKFLPRDIRAGEGPPLMFEDGRWQPLKPVGIRHGLEIPFAYAMAKLLLKDAVGVIVCNGSLKDVIPLVAEAKVAIPAEVAAVIQLREKSADRVVFEKKISDKLGNPKAVLVDMTPLIPVSPSDLDRSDSIGEKGRALAEYVFNRMTSKGKE